MVTPNCLDIVLPVVADSWDKLRKCDIYRLMDQIHYESKESAFAAAAIIASHRPEFRQEAEDCAAELQP